MQKLHIFKQRSEPAANCCVERRAKAMHDEEYDPGLCVGCEVCSFPPRDCPQCKLVPDDEDG